MFQDEINGYQNEYQFVQYLNGKLVGECHPLFESLLFRLYGPLSKEDQISCWKNHLLQKTDIFIKINGVVKRISLKKGIKNSVHVEGISDFIHFLIVNGIPRNIIIAYLHYQYADGTTNGTGIERFSTEEYKKEHQCDIDEMNQYFNKRKLVQKAIHRFVLQGRNDTYQVDALVYGVVDDFLFITREEIEEILLNNQDYSTGIHFSSLFVQPLDRCLNRNPKYEKRRFCIQVKWFNLFDDIIRYRQAMVNGDTLEE